jgi:Ca2+-binding RTX toxin-like protein
MAATMRKRATLAAATGLLAVALSTGTAFAAGPPEGAIYGTSGNDVLRGTALDDYLVGNRGNDVLVGRGGDDSLFGDTVTFGEGDLTGKDVLVGGAGSDFLNGGPGDDGFFAKDGERDTISCGPGLDTYVADPIDVVAADCEIAESGQG